MATSDFAVARQPRTALQIGSEMVFEHIEKLKQEYTDKYVIVDETRPELRRFGGMTGTVRTVNMSGRALVEFDAYANIGWYDIDVDFLKVIDAPLPKPEAKPAAKKEAKPAAKKEAKPAAKKEAKPAAKKEAKPAAKQAEAKASPKAAPAAKQAPPASKPASGAGLSVADMLAAARGDKGGAAAPAAKPSSAAEIMAAARSDKSGGAAPAKADAKSMSVADMLAAARGEKSGGAPVAKAAASASAAPAPAAAPKKDPKSMSVTEMLAAARGEKGGGGATAAAPAASSTDPKSGVRDMLEAARKPKPGAVAIEEPAAEAAPAAEVASAGSGERRNDITSVVEQLAYCRKVDAS